MKQMQTALLLVVLFTICLHANGQTQCRSSSECASNRACRSNRCVDPCTNACGTNAICQARNHAADCSCPSGYTGDPFTRCTRS